MRRLLLGTLSVLALGLSSPVFAAIAQDAAYDNNSNPVFDSNGHCVRTKWQGANDPCGAPPPAPKKFVPAPVPPAPMPEVSLEQRTVYFEFNKATLTDEAKLKLDNLAQVINASSSIGDVRIHGFTDQIGTKGYNDVLANKRAKAVKTYLDGKSRLHSTVAEVMGLGKSDPTEGCGAMKRDEKIACMYKERRVEIELKATK